MDERDERRLTHISAVAAISSHIHWNTFEIDTSYTYQEPALTISYTVYGKYTEKQTKNFLRNHLNDTDDFGFFVSFNNGVFYIDSDKLRVKFPDTYIHSWIQGIIKPYYEFSVDLDNDLANEIRGFRPNPKSRISLVISRDEAREAMPKRIFLSHKSANKPLVREYFLTLKEMGLDPWLDEEDMPAGVKLHRALLKGMNESCAAVFFITSEYHDKDFLESEIDAAVSRKMELGDDFSIIALQIKDGKNESVMPDLLKSYVWKTISIDEQLKGLREILKALPFSAKIVP